MIRARSKLCGSLVALPGSCELYCLQASAPCAGSVASTRLMSSPCQGVAAAATTSSGSSIGLQGSGSAWAWASPFPLAAALALSLGAGATCEAIESKSASETPSLPVKSYLFGLQTRQRIFFKYEKRVRDFSPMDKVFEYFASQERDNIKYMLPSDMLHAVVVTYPSSHSMSDRAGSLDGERQPEFASVTRSSSVFEQFDVDGDGLISYYEFLLLLTLLSIPQRDIQTIFKMMDEDGNGDISADEFRTVTSKLQNLAVSSGVPQNKTATNRSRKVAGGDVGDSSAGLLTSFFGKTQTKTLKLNNFIHFLTQLHEELVRMEFHHYAEPSTAGSSHSATLSGIDFARSMVVTADIKTVETLLSKVENMDSSLLGASISYEEFRSVHLQLQSFLHDLTVALDFMDQVNKRVNESEFVSMVQSVCGMELSPQVVSIIMATFGDATGRLDKKTFLECLGRRGYLKGRG